MCQMTDNKVYIRFKIIFIFFKNVLMCSLHPFYAVYFIFLYFFYKILYPLVKGRWPNSAMRPGGFTNECLRKYKKHTLIRHNYSVVPRMMSPIPHVFFLRTCSVNTMQRNQRGACLAFKVYKQRHNFKLQSTKNGSIIEQQQFRNRHAVVIYMYF